MKEKKKLDKICIGLYVVAVLFGIYTIFTIINTSLYISDLVTIQGLDIGSNISNVVSYFMTTCASYLFYAIVLGVMGYELTKLHRYFDADQDKTDHEEVAETLINEVEVITSMASDNSNDEVTAEGVIEETEEKEEKEEV